jgi:hypothetical protein
MSARPGRHTTTRRAGPQPPGPARLARPAIWLGIVAAALAAFASFAGRAGAPRAAGAELSQGEAAGVDLESLLAQFAAMPGLTARFREEKRIALLREPLVSHGVLYFAPPDRLLRRVRKPVESSLLLHGGTLSLGSARGTRTIDLGSNPLVRSFVDSFRLLLAGDLEALRASYRVRFQAAEAAGGPTQRGWEVRLEPLLPAVQQAIAWIRLSGRGRLLSELEVREVGGDVTLTRFSAVDPERHFSDLELEKLFQPPAP